MSRLLFVLAASLWPTLAFAHVGIGDVQGLSHGFLHPLGGIDHVMVMVAVGLLAARIGGRALWLVPLSFVGMMIAGGALGMTGSAMPFVEIGIGLSIVVLGLVFALGLNLPVAGAMALVGLFAVFHGHAHGAEMPETASGLGYGLGFVAATSLLHVAGIGLGLAIACNEMRYGRRTAQWAGGAMTFAGAAILAGAL